MADHDIAERVIQALITGGRSRVQVCSCFSPLELAGEIQRSLSGYRVLVFDCTLDDPYRAPLLEYFTGGCYPDPSASFDAGWRSHLIEMSLMGGEGMEKAAGLQSLRNDIREYLLHGEGGSRQVQGLLASFSVMLPTVLILAGWETGSWLPCDDMPVTVFLSRGAGADPLADLHIDSTVFREDGGSDLVKGLSRVFGVPALDPSSTLERVFEEHLEFRRFSAAAAVLSPGFHPAEAAAAAGTSDWKEAIELGRASGLFTGHLVCSMTSASTAELVLRKAAEGGERELRRRAAGEVLRFRGRNPAALAKAAAILLRGGEDAEAAALYAEAGEKETLQLPRAEYLKSASLLSPEFRSSCTFQAALSLYRADRPDDALALLEGDTCGDDPDSVFLRAFCSPGHDVLEGDGCLFNELNPEILSSRCLHGEGEYFQAETLLLRLAADDPPSAPPAMVELGEQFFKRGLYGQAICAARSALALSFPSECWLEIKARFILAMACYRTGRFMDTQRNAERLTMLLLQNRDRRRLVLLYNLLANSLLLRNDLEGALETYGTALRTVERDGLPGAANILNNMSVAHRKLQSTDQALRTLMKLVRVCVSSGDLGRAAVAYGNMARLFIDLSRFDSAADCLESMMEFSRYSGRDLEESVCYISSQIAFHQGQHEEALALLGRAAEIARAAGSSRRLSLNLVKRGSLLLRMGRYGEAAKVLAEGREVSQQSNSRLNWFLAGIKLLAAQAMEGHQHPSALLAMGFSPELDSRHKGELYYWHWKLSGSAQSMTAAAQLLSRGLADGFHHHSYLYMLHEIAEELPPALAASLPLVHNYPSP